MPRAVLFLVFADAAEQVLFAHATGALPRGGPQPLFHLDYGGSARSGSRARQRRVPQRDRVEHPARRGVPDVAADASPVTNMAVARGAPGGTYMLTPASGTSAGGPFRAGLIALADQEAGHPLGFVNPAIYRIARGPLYHKAFHDITAGSNTMTRTSTSPPVTITGYQQVLIPLLAR